MERTLVILKPEALEWHIVGKVLQYWDDEGFRLVACRVATEPVEKWTEHYKEVLARIPTESGVGLLQRMSRGDCMFAIFEGENCIARTREFLGATDPSKAVEGTIRNVHGRSVDYNVAHASDSPESAAREIALWFE